MFVKPANFEEVFSRHEIFLSEYAEAQAVEDLKARAKDLQGSIGAISVNDFLKPGSLTELNTVLDESFRGGGRIIFAPITIAFIELLSDLSRMYVTRHPMLEVHNTIKPLSYNPDNPKFHTLIPTHHDWKDGNAVLFNWDVTGEQEYHLGREILAVASNQLIVIKGDSTYLTSQGAYGSAAHSVEAAKNVPKAALKTLARKRILFFWDGEPTDIDMVPPEEA